VSGAGMVNVFFVQIQPAAKALSPSDVQAPVELSRTSKVQSCVVLLGPAVVHLQTERGHPPLLATPAGRL